MNIYEEAVLTYITSSPKRFINPQFNIEWDKESKTGGSLPDFIVLDFEEKTIYIVEVTVAWNIDGLLKKVEDKNTRWIEPLKSKFANECFKDWDYHVTLFLRDERVEYAKNKTNRNEVTIISLKKINVFLGNGEFDSKAKLS